MYRLVLLFVYFLISFCSAFSQAKLPISYSQNSKLEIGSFAPQKYSSFRSGTPSQHGLRMGEREIPVQTPDGATPTERELATIKSVLTDDFLVNDDTSGGTAFQTYPSIAMDGNGNFVVVWTDYRNMNDDIYCQRYDSIGTAKGVNFKVNDNAVTALQENPSIAMDVSGNFVVVWTDYRNMDPDIYCQQYDSTGLAKGINFKVNDDVGTSAYSYPSIAMDRSGNFVVVWVHDLNYNSDIYCQQYNSTGFAKGVNFKVNDDTGTATQWSPSITMDGSGNFIVAWHDGRNGNYDIYCQRYDSTGFAKGVNSQVNDDAGVADQYDPSITMDGNGNFIVVWRDDRNGNSDIYCQRYNSSGAAQGVNFKVNDDAGIASQYSPSITMDGSGNFIVVWRDDRNFFWDIYCQRYNSSGVAQGANFKVNDDIGTSLQQDPSIAMDGSGNFIVVWRDDRNGNTDIYCQRYDSTGTAKDINFIINNDAGTANQSYASIAMNSSGNFVVAWEDYRNYNCDIYCQRYNSSGIAQGVNFKANDDIGTASQYDPSIAMDEMGNIVVAWWDIRNGNYDIYCQRYNSSGVALGANFKVNDDTGIAHQRYPSIAIDGNNGFVIVWEDRRDYYNYFTDIYCQRYDSTGTAKGVNFRVNDDAGRAEQFNPYVATDKNQNFIVVWNDSRNENSGIYCQRYNSLGINFKVNNAVGTASQYDLAIAIAGSGNFAVVWASYRNMNTDIYCQRYDSTGVVQGTNFKVNNVAGKDNQYGLSIAMDESGNIVIVWTDYRYGSNNPNIMGQRYHYDGSPWGTNYHIVADGPNHGEKLPVVAANANSIVFSWTDNRRSKGWDIYAKMATWDWDGETSVSDDRTQLPKEYGLSQNYPNPFNPLTIINYQLPTNNFVTLKVFNLLGQEVANLVEEIQAPGSYSVSWNSVNYTSGVYYYRLTAGNYSEVKRMILLK
jgi:hypothetical protein